MRGDHASRGRADRRASSRTKESGRFLRRKGTQGVAAQRGGVRPRSTETSGSPSAGSEVTIESPITIKHLAEALSVKASQLVGKAFTALSLPVNINSTLDEEAATLLALEYEVTLKVVHEEKAEAALLAELVRKRPEVGGRSAGARPRPRPSWATSTTARPRCSTPCGSRAWRRASPAASPSTSAPTRSRPRRATC